MNAQSSRLLCQDVTQFHGPVLLQFFEKEGCKMVEMSCEEHDRQAASTQFITHTVGRVLGAMELQATPIDTRQDAFNTSINKCLMGCDICDALNWIFSACFVLHL